MLNNQITQRQLESNALRWIEQLIGEKLTNKTFHDALKSGVVLCK